nr:adenosylcobinamide amidohydrolase [Paenibacillus sp. SYP-B3998]
MQIVESRKGTYLLIRSEQPLRTLNSSPWGGGFGSHTSLMNRQVDKHYQAADPITEMNEFITREGMSPSEIAGMLTAAIVKDVGCSFLSLDQIELQSPIGQDQGQSQEQEQAQDQDQDQEQKQKQKQKQLQVNAWVTVGLGNKARAGAELPAASLYPGTINCIVIINGILTDAAMVNSIITATEAKSAALQALGIEVDGLPATGTTTDAVLIAATGRGRLHSYAGTATQLGYLIGRTVYEAIMQSAQLYEKKPC